MPAPRRSASPKRSDARSSPRLPARASCRRPSALPRRPACRSTQPRRLLREADVILAVGTEISETDLWESRITFPARLIRIDIDPATLARPHARRDRHPGRCRDGARRASPQRCPQPIMRPAQAEREACIRDHLAGEIGMRGPAARDLRMVLGGHPRGAAARHHHRLRHDADRLCRQ